MPIVSLSGFWEALRGALAFKIAFAFSIQILAFAVTYTSSANFFTAEDLTGIAAAGAAVNAVLLLPALFVRVRWAVNGWLTLVALGGVWSGYVMHTSLYADENYALLYGGLVAAAFALFSGFRVIDEVRASGAALNAAALIGVAVMIGPHISVGGADPELARTPVPAYFENIREITFTETPNLYFLSFDGLAPRSLMKKHIGLDTTELHGLVDAKFRRLPNFFSNAMATSESLDILLSLDEEVWERGMKFYQTSIAAHSSLFSGVHPSPLFHILKQNGYTITTLIPDSHFGHPQGPHIDNYHVLSMRHLVCDKSGAGTAPLAFWGYCRIIGGGSVLSHEAAQFGDGNKQANFLLERLTALDRQTPQFLFSYLYLPGHFPNKHRLKNAQHVAAYRKVVVEKNRMAAHALEEILAHLKRHDPNAIVFLFGDHGMLHSSERSIHTAFGALGAVWPPNRCTAELDAEASKGYMTILDTAHALLRCVSGGQSALLKPRARKNNVMGVHAFLDHNKTFADRNITFGDFRYE